MAKDMLFATLDPTMRAVTLPDGKKVILSDTVGFISELPTHLIAAFRATLEEVLAADVILVVSDHSHPDCDAQRKDVVSVLSDLDIDIESSDVPVIDVYNKVDSLQQDQAEAVVNCTKREPRIAAVSALTGFGCEDLLAKVADAIKPEMYAFTVKVLSSDGALISWIYQHAIVLSESVEGAQMSFDLEMDRKVLGRLHKKAENIIPPHVLQQFSALDNQEQSGQPNP